jgi:hypothetical protein
MHEYAVIKEKQLFRCANEFKKDEFPKTCSKCGTIYNTKEQFISLPFKNNVHNGKPEDDPGRQCMEITWNIESDLDLLYRDCIGEDCGSTLNIFVRCIHDKKHKLSTRDEDFAEDDGPNKYDREKNNKKWEEILIDKDGIKLTRRGIRNHYFKNKDKILKEIKDKPVMLYLLTDKNKTILKRNHNDKEIIITNADKDKSGNPDNLVYWADRRLASIHLVMGKNTKLGWVDLDIHGNFPKAKALEYAKKVSPVLKKELGGNTQIWESGGTGYHVEIELPKEMNIDNLRNKLKDILDNFNKDWKMYQLA